MVETITYGGERIIVVSPSSSPLGMYGDGYTFALAYRGNVEVSPTGEEEFPLLIYPDDTLINRYSLQKLIDEKGIMIGGYPAIWVRYDRRYIKQINPSDSHAFQWIIKCNFNGGKTPLSEDESILIDEHKFRDREKQSMLSRLAIQRRQIEELQNSLLIQAKNYRKILEEMGRRKEEEEDGEKKESKD